MTKTTIITILETLTTILMKNQELWRMRMIIPCKVNLILVCKINFSSMMNLLSIETEINKLHNNSFRTPIYHLAVP